MPHHAEPTGQHGDREDEDDRHQEAPAQAGRGADEPDEHAAEHRAEVVEPVEPGDDGVGVPGGEQTGRREAQRRDQAEAGAGDGEPEHRLLGAVRR